jgi:hypothetical protein
MRPRGLLPALLALLVAGCGSPTISTEPVDAPLAVGCIRVADVAGCRAMADAAVDRLQPGDGEPTYVHVFAFSCDIDCGPGFAGERHGIVIIDTTGDNVVYQAILATNGRITEAERGDKEIRWHAAEPQSARAGEARVTIDIGHCGIDSGIDVDGSFWDPVGFIPDHPDAINSARAEVAFTSEMTAVLQTEGGLVLQIQRHPGQKHLPGCD